MVTAKIMLQFKGEPQDGQVQLNFVPDYQDGRNKEWAKYTPNLSLVMTVLESVADKFETGRSYTIPFIPSEE